MAKDYLRCRMEQYVLLLASSESESRTVVAKYRYLINSNLMAPDEFKNLGFADEDKRIPGSSHAGDTGISRVGDDGKKIP